MKYDMDLLKSAPWALMAGEMSEADLEKAKGYLAFADSLAEVGVAHPDLDAMRAILRQLVEPIETTSEAVH